MKFERGHALLIGVGSYRYMPKAKIPVSMQDAQQVHDVLINERFCGYRQENVVLLHDEQASREGILAALKNIAQKTTEADTVLLYYSGHGEYGSDGLYYMTCHDTKAVGNRIVPGTGICEKELLDALRAISAGKLIFFFNACHSGEVSPHLGLDEEGEVGDFGSTILPNATADAILASGSGRVIITACREAQKSWIGKGEISIFARALVDGLKGRARYNVGYIGAFGLYEYLYEAVKEAASDLKQEQEPEITVMKGIGPFPVALCNGAEPQAFDAVQEVLPEQAPVRYVSEKASQREFQRITRITIQTGGGAYVAGNVNTGGGDFVGRDQHKVTITGDVKAPVIAGQGNITNVYLTPESRVTDARDKVTETPNILLITVNKIETQAVLEVMLKTTGSMWQRRHIGGKTYYDLGFIGGASVSLVQSEMGSATPGGAILTVRQAIDDLRPCAVIMTGVAFGMRPDKQKLGNILVATHMMSYEPGKIKDSFLPRGVRVNVSTALLVKFRSGDLDWKGATVHFGLILSGEKLVNDLEFRQWLCTVEPEAIGGEMEGAGLYAAASDARVDWILIKGICDWADGNKDDLAQPMAARNTAEFVLHVLQQGGWEEYAASLPERQSGSSFNAHLTGSGAIAQGPGAKAVGQGGTLIEGDAHKNLGSRKDQEKGASDDGGGW